MVHFHIGSTHHTWCGQNQEYATRLIHGDTCDDCLAAVSAYVRDHGDVPDKVLASQNGVEDFINYHRNEGSALKPERR